MERSDDWSMVTFSLKCVCSQSAQASSVSVGTLSNGIRLHTTLNSIISTHLHKHDYWLLFSAASATLLRTRLPHLDDTDVVHLQYTVLPTSNELRGRTRVLSQWWPDYRMTFATSHTPVHHKFYFLVTIFTYRPRLCCTLCSMLSL